MNQTQTWRFNIIFHHEGLKFKFNTKMADNKLTDPIES